MIDENMKRYNEIVSLAEDCASDIICDFSSEFEIDYDCMLAGVRERLYIFMLEVLKYYS